MNRRLASLAALLVAAGCSHEKDGPSPSLGMVAPQAACSEEIASVVMIHGDGLSPLNDLVQTDQTVGGKSATGQLELPLLQLTRTRDIDGNAVTGADNVVTVPNDPAHPEQADEQWTDQKDMAFSICPPGTCSQAMRPTADYALAPGLYSLAATNRNGKSVTLPDAIAVVPVPRLDGVKEDLACQDQDDTFTLTGDFLLRVNGAPSTVTIGDKPFTPTAMTDCRDLPAPAGFHLEACKTATVFVPAKTFSTGTVPVVVTGPTPVGCHSREVHTITFVPEPTVAKAQPDLLCLDDHDQTVTVTGTGFLSIDGVLPTVILDGGHTVAAATVDGCTPVAGPKEVVQSCTTLTFHLAMSGLPDGNYDVVVKNPPPADCPSRQKVDLAVVPRPTLTSVVPDVICSAQGDRTLLLNGRNLLTVDGVTPTVLIDGQPYPSISPGGCAPLAGPTETVQACTSLMVLIPQNMLGAGTHQVVVQNPSPAGCASTPAIDLVVVAPPILSSVAPDLACNAQGDDGFTLTGTGFLGVGGAAPTVTAVLNGQTVATAKAQLVNGSCMTVAGTTEAVQSCTSLHVTFPKGTLLAGGYGFTVTNPDPAGCASGPVSVAIIAPPSVMAVNPAQVCTAQGDVALTIVGANFLTVGNAVPTVTLAGGNGQPLVVGNGVTASACQPIAGLVEAAQLCTQLTVPVPKNGLAGGVTYTAKVTNPPPAACTSTDAATVAGVAPPLITSVQPKVICAGGDTITVSGANFANGDTVSLGGVLASSVTSPNPSTLIATFVAGLKPGGPYDLTVSNGCSSTLPAAVTVTPGPAVFFVDPPVVWNGIGTLVTVYGANIVPPIKSIELVPSGGGNPVALQFTTTPQHPNRATATVPKELAAGAYDVRLHDQTSCPAILSQGLKVAAATSFTPTVTPTFGFDAAPTAVTIGSKGAFLDTPRAYLNPTGGNAVATALASVAFLGTSTLTAVVPVTDPKLAAGKYDLIVVNPDGTVGVAQGGFTVVASPPPVVLDVVPGSVQTSQPVTFTVSGQNFANGATVSLQCLDQGGNPIAAPQLNAGMPANCSPGPQCIAVGATFGSSGVCVVRVSNPDGSFFDFSSLAINNPALKLGAFGQQSAMTTGRRALAVAAVNATPSARYLYALGGDGGSEAGALATVEAAPIDVFGRMGQWRALPSAMTKPRTFLGAVAVGRAIYAVGGSTGAGATATVERAWVLDPLAVPQIGDVDLLPGGGQGLAGGVFTYRVAPVMANNDPFNPGGEGLASDEFVIQLPSLPDKIQVTLSFTAVAGADHYRVYRSATPDQPGGHEVLIADNVPANALVFTDAGVQPISQAAPLPPGATGVWVPVASMGTARMGAGLVAVADPGAANTFHVYALGGNSGSSANPAPLATTESVTIVVDNDGSQTVGAWSSTGRALSSARWEIGGYAQLVNGQQWIWAGAGDGANKAIDRGTDGAQVTAGGALGAFASLAPHDMDQRAGYAAVSVNGFLFALGGAMGAPDTGGIQGQIAQPPQVANWPFSTSLSTARYLTAGVVVSGFIFVVGGQTNQQAATASTESTIW